MKLINEILDEAIVIDDSHIISRVYSYTICKGVPLRFVMSDINLSLGTVMSWELQLIKFVYNMHNSNSFVQSLDMTRLEVDKNANIVGESIRPSSYIKMTASEVASINIINDIHTAYFTYLNSFELSEERLAKINLLFMISSYYYSASIRVNKRCTLHYYIRCIEQFNIMVQFGFIEDLYASLGMIFKN